LLILVGAAQATKQVRFSAKPKEAPAECRRACPRRDKRKYEGSEL